MILPSLFHQPIGNRKQIKKDFGNQIGGEIQKRVIKNQQDTLVHFTKFVNFGPEQISGLNPDLQRVSTPPIYYCDFGK